MADDKKQAPAVQTGSIESYATATLREPTHFIGLGSIERIHVGFVKGEAKITSIEGNPRHLVVRHAFEYTPKSARGVDRVAGEQTTRIPWSNVKSVEDTKIDAK